MYKLIPFMTSREAKVCLKSPVKVFDLGRLEIPLPIRVLDSVLETLSTVTTIKNVGIMEHPRKALQGLNHNVIHGNMSGLTSLALHES